MAYRILIVDDENALQNMVKEILTQSGYETVSALTCAQALKRFHDASPDGVLLDVNLPDGDGFTLFGKLREVRDVPVLFLSARDEDADRLWGLGLGADDYITKPFEMKEVLARIEAVLRRSGQRLTARRLSPELQRTIGVIYKQKTGLSTAGQLFLSELKASRIPPRG